MKSSSVKDSTNSLTSMDITIEASSTTSKETAPAPAIPAVTAANATVATIAAAPSTATLTAHPSTATLGSERISPRRGENLPRRMAASRTILF